MVVSVLMMAVMSFATSDTSKLAPGIQKAIDSSENELVLIII